MPGDSDKKEVKESDDAKQEACKGKEIPQSTLVKGQAGDIHKKKRLVISNKADWETLWHKLQEKDRTIPRVDFSQSLVLAVFQGKKPNGGHLVSIDHVCRDDQNIAVTVLNKKPKEECLVSSALTYPFHVVKISKATFNDVSFNEKEIETCSEEMNQKKRCQDLIQTTPFQKGAYSGIDAEKEMVIRNERDWLKLSDKMKGEKLPSINFQKKMIIAVFQGQKPTGGYSIYVDEVCRKKNGIEVNVHKEKPGSNCKVTQAVTSPYELVILPKFQGDLSFNSVTKAKECE